MLQHPSSRRAHVRDVAKVDFKNARPVLQQRREGGGQMLRPFPVESPTEPDQRHLTLARRLDLQHHFPAPTTESAFRITSGGITTPNLLASPFEVMQGATLSFFPDFQEGGVEAGKMIARVLRGERPAAIPFHRLEKTRVIVNPGEASKLGVVIPPDVIRKADSVVGAGK